MCIDILYNKECNIPYKKKQELSILLSFKSLSLNHLLSSTNELWDVWLGKITEPDSQNPDVSSARTVWTAIETWNKRSIELSAEDKTNLGTTAQKKTRTCIGPYNYGWMNQTPSVSGTFLCARTFSFTDNSVNCKQHSIIS